MKIHWPPPPLGLGTPLNLVALSRETRPLLGRWWWVAPVFGLAAALLLVGIDEMFFGGETVQRLPDLSSHPSLAARVLVVFFGSVIEELFFRVFIATLVAWLGHMVLARFMGRPRAYAQWLGILVAAILAGLWQVGSPADVLRVVGVNGVVGAVYGWVYWWRGLELAILTHMVVTGFLYIAVPVFV